MNGTERRKDNQLQSLELPCRECRHDIKESKGNMLNPIFKENVQGRQHPGSCAFAESDLLRYKTPKCNAKSNLWP